MLDHKVLNEEIVNKIFENSDKIILKIDKNANVLEYSKCYEELILEFKNLKDLITYTHIDDFLKRLEQLNLNNPIDKFVTNFSFDKSNVEDIPSTYNIILYQNENETITLVAEPLHPLSQEDAKIYLSMINDFSETSRKLTKTKLKLKRLNDNLKEEIKQAVNELRQKDKLLLKQAKDAAMGEMIDSIAHQWKGPLGIIKLLSEAIRMEYEFFDKPDSKEIIKDTIKIEKQINHMVETLEEFRGFFRPNVSTKIVSLFSIVESVNTLMKDELIKNEIDIIIKGDDTLKVDVVPNQFKHVLINLISNSKDAFIEKSIKDRKIYYQIKKEYNNSVVLKFYDNAGGIKDSIIKNIFEANFTTKEKTKGTGIGLYMTKKIVDKANGEIKVYNYNDGICFEIILPLAS